MKNHYFCLLFTLLAMFLAPRLFGQTTSPTYPDAASKMNVSQFINWVVGTQWDFTDSNQKVVSMKFATPSLILFTEQGRSGDAIHYFRECTIIDKGVVEWRGNSFDESVISKCKIDENLSTSFVQVGSAAFRARMVERKPLKFPRVPIGDFVKLLHSSDLICDIGTINFIGPVQCSIKNEADYSHGSYKVRMQGIVSMKPANGSDSLIIVNEDLKGFELIHSGKKTQGLIQQRLAGQTPSTVPISSTQPASSDAAMVGSPGDSPVFPEIQLTTQNAGISGLLIRDMGNSRYAGEASKLSVSALKVESGNVASLAFNQEVGPDMSKALEEVKRFQTMRHGGWPRNYAMQLAFADKYTPKDGPSAAVACALILESIITGVQLSQSFAVTGNMNADGTVQPIGGVAAKLRGAGNSNMEIVAIPEKNRTSAVDLIITEGVTPFLGAQIVSISTFDEALAMASANKTDSTREALDKFRSIITTLKQNPAALRTVTTVEALTEVSTAIPNHVSAKLLLAAASNRLPTRLSPAGSLEAIDQAIGGIMEAVGTDLSATNGLDAGQLGYAKTRLNRLRSQVDTRVNPLVDAWLGWAALADQIIVRRSAPPHVVTQFRAAAGRINSEAAKLKGNVEFNEALER